MIDASIAMGVKPVQIDSPLNALAQMMQIKNIQQQNQLGELTMQDHQRTFDDANKMRALMGESDFDASSPASMRRVMAINPTQGLAFQKAQLDNRKTTADVNETVTKTAHAKIGMYRDALDQVSTPEQAGQWLQAQYSDPDTAPIMNTLGTFEQAKSRIPMDPQDFAVWRKQSALGMAKFTELNKPTISTRNLGGTTETFSTDGLTGASRVVNSSVNSQSPDSVASNITSRANNAATVGASIRGQNMTDARSRESTAATVGKPFEVTGPDGTPVLVQQDKQGNLNRVEGFGPKAGAGKALTEGQSKAVLFGARMESANKIMADLAAKGADTARIGANTGFGVGSIVNATGSDDQQGLNQAQRDFVNAVLRRESGASISPAEFESAQKQYFPQVGEGAAVKKQKENARAIAIRGMQAEIPAASKGLVSEVINGPSTTSGFNDAAKEARYQAWKAGQNK